MSTSPAAIAVTIPPDDTVATLVLEDCHAAWPDTDRDVPSDKAADALNCALSPGFAEDKAPLTVTEVTVAAAEAGLVGLLGVDALPPPPQLMNDTVIPAASATAPNNRIMMLSFEF
jgi:hypothetical protein